ncbi:hypothetical protein KFU94_06930 [Chloroflexi bacterium TSY]|nr:hypothetical protein [Chloroflexi bacterium TSY]
MIHYREVLRTTQTHTESEKLETINKIASFFITQSKLEKAFALLTFVRRHPAADRISRQFATEKCRELHLLLSEEAVTEIEETARTATIELVVSELLNEIGADC